MIVDYITKNQNKWVYASLFHNNLVTLLKKGVRLADLFESEIFMMPVKFPEWPSASPDTTKCLMPYSESIFDLHERYKDIFAKQLDSERKEDDKMFKIKYDCNLLVSVNEHPDDETTSIMQGLSQTNELALFDTELVKETIEFKWNNFASKIHFIGAGLHFGYTFCLITYIKYTFVVLGAISYNELIPAHIFKNND